MSSLQVTNKYNYTSSNVHKTIERGRSYNASLMIFMRARTKLRDYGGVKNGSVCEYLKNITNAKKNICFPHISTTKFFTRDDVKLCFS